MAFISYAQNYEDVMLWRALHDVEQGFYVDIGAADPDNESVTRAFYERGWSGINVEPFDELFAKLVQARPRDTNLKIAAGRDEGVRTLHAFSGTGLSTFDPQISAQHQRDGFEVHQMTVPVLTLTKILEDCGPPPVIHFLKIDVEGVEVEVLEGLDLERLRPWIIVVEATKPNSTENTRSRWEHLVSERGYTFAYFDGLNCFYVADEVSHLKEQLKVPPNFFDDFVRWPEWSSRQSAAALEEELAGLRGHASRLETALEATASQAESSERALVVARQEAAQLRGALATERAHGVDLQRMLDAQQTQRGSLRASIRRFKDPLIKRSAGKLLQQVFQRLRETGDRLTGGGARALGKRLWTTSVRRTGPFVMGFPPTAALARGILRPFPRVATYLYRLANPEEANALARDASAGAAGVSGAADSESRASALPASARAIYSRLLAAAAGNAAETKLP